MACVEGVFEFLPISSTAHLLIISKLFNVSEGIFDNHSFEIIIQVGPIFAILYQYFSYIFHQKFDKNLLNFIVVLGIITMPTCVIAFLFYDFIKLYLYNIEIIAYALIIGGVVILIFENLYDKKNKVEFNKTTEEDIVDISSISYKDSFIIGVFQSVALVPGVSRSLVTILGGMYCSFTRIQSAQLSFIAGIPIILIAGSYEYYQYIIENIKNSHMIHGTSYAVNTMSYEYLITGVCISFLVALFTIRILLKFISKYSFRIFAYYRFIIGFVILLFI